MNNEAEQNNIIHGQPNDDNPAQNLGESAATPQNAEDFSKVCRICATETEYVIHLFDWLGLQNNLAERINQYLPIQVRRGDSLPVVVCRRCAGTLAAWHALSRGCPRAAAALRDRLARAAVPHHPHIQGCESSNQAAFPDAEANTNNTYRRIARQRAAATREESTRQCTYCGDVLPLSRYKPHLIAEHADSLFLCDECDEYIDRKDLIRHMSRHALEYNAERGLVQRAAVKRNV